MSKIKECFTSRFDGGRLIEFDYSQLEVIGLAILSNDLLLKNDLRLGIDLHCQNAANLFNSNYTEVKSAYDSGDVDWTSKRKLAKAFSFALQYGAGAPSMAKDNGVPLKLAQKFIEEYYNRYSGVKEWQESNIEFVKKNAKKTTNKTALGFPSDQSHLESKTGRWYTFHEFDSPKFMKDKGIDTSFSPTQIKNYPVQGFSTGDIVPLAIGEIIKYILENNMEEQILLINTIHDSILIDCKPWYTAQHTEWTLEILEHLRNLKKILVSIPEDINKLWPDINFDLPLDVDATYGTNWGNMKPLTL